MGERKALLQSLDCASGGSDCKCAFLCGGQIFYFLDVVTAYLIFVILEFLKLVGVGNAEK